MEEGNGKDIPEILYKYRTLTINTYDQILHEYFWASTFDKFNDVFEFYSWNEFVREIWKKHGEMKIFLSPQHVLDSIKMKILISSFTTKNNNVAMWTYYADNGKGVCLGYDISSYRDNISKVNYIKDDKLEDMKKKVRESDKINEFIVSSDDFFDFVKIFGLMKKYDWASEQEYRYFKRVSKITPEEQKNKAHIKSIYIGYNSDPRVKELLKQLTKDKDIKICQANTANGKIDFLPA